MSNIGNPYLFSVDLGAFFLVKAELKVSARNYPKDIYLIKRSTHFETVRFEQVYLSMCILDLCFVFIETIDNKKIEILKYKDLKPNIPLYIISMCDFVNGHARISLDFILMCI